MRRVVRPPHALENMVTLCSLCHSPAEHGVYTESIRCKLEALDKDAVWYYCRLLELGILNPYNPYQKRAQAGKILAEVSAL